MPNVNQSNSRAANGPHAKIAGAIGGGGGVAIGLLMAHFADFQSLWLSLATVCAGIVIGILLSKLAFRW